MVERFGSQPSEDNPRGKRRERWDLGDGAYMDISIEPGASAETIAALRQIGELAVKRMRDESLTYDESEIPERGTPFRLASRPPSPDPEGEQR